MKKEEMVYCLKKAKDLNFLKGSSIVSNKVTPANNSDFFHRDGYISLKVGKGLSGKKYLQENGHRKLLDGQIIK